MTVHAFSVRRASDRNDTVTLEYDAPLSDDDVTVIVETMNYAVKAGAIGRPPDVKKERS